MNIYILIPGYNEEKYIETVLKNVLEITSNVIYVDDGSLDKSATIAKRYIANVLVHEVNLGKGAALKTGCEYAFKKLKADAVVFMDADNQHKATELPQFFQSLENGSEVVFGVRRLSSNMPLIRFLGNKMASVILNILFHRYIPDILSGYKAISKNAYKKLYWASTGYEVEMEIAVRAAKQRLPYHILEIETIYHDKSKGVNLIDALKTAFRLLQWRVSL